VNSQTLTPDVLESALAQMPPAEIEELAHLLHERATRERRRLTTDEARAAISTATLSPAWEKSILRDVGQIRCAAKELLLAGWRSEQIATALATAGLELEGDGGLVALSIAAGIADAQRLLS
jgi:hypothetical protein